ncbi:MAG: flagellar basal-body rod protein FlgF [Candidatus Sumerlaeota bacterium]|nr:flagellar basal-body rod protein FlgF [Candidatus Sumerlaeota bacterium]
MDDLYIALSSAMALERHLDVVANNMANTNTVGYKQDVAQFESLLPDTDSILPDPDLPPDQQPSKPPQSPLVGPYFVNMRGTFTDFAQGDLRETNNPLDLALQGPGFFAVETPQGERYTRAGAFVLNSKGELTTPDGARVLGEGGPIVLTSARISVADDGSILQDANPVGRFRVVQFDDLRALDKTGANLFQVGDANAAPRASVPEDGTVVRQNTLEYSNVNMISEMVRLIQTERSYTMAEKAIKTIDEAAQTAIGGVLR